MRILATIGLGLLLWWCAPRGVSAGEPAVTRITRSATSKFFVRHTPDGSHLVYSSQHANRRASNQVLVGARIVRVDGTDDRPLLLKMQMGAGHRGPSGRYDAWRDEAFVLAFVLDQVGLAA